MSADTTIIIGRFSEDIYKVSIVQGAENIEYMVEEKRWGDLDEWVEHYFNSAPPFSNRGDAYSYARGIEDDEGWMIEYGVLDVDFEEIKKERNEIHNQN